jgi:hypothetical protein
MASPPQLPLQFIVEFNGPLTPDSASTLELLSKHAGASVSYITSISDSTHIYRVHTKNPSDSAALLAQLRKAPSIRNASIDQIRQHH